MASVAKRSQYFDNAKFILIFLVVFGHVISPLKEKDSFLITLYSGIFLFHMPAFIFISGFFSKNFRKKGHFLKIVKHVLVPYFIFQVIYSLFYYWTGQEDKLTFDLFQPHWTLWFLLSLFFWHVLLYVFAKLRWAGFFIALALGIGIGYFDHIGSYLSISRTFVYFPYFLLGYLLKPEPLKKLLKNRFAIPAGTMIMLAVFLVFAPAFPRYSMAWLLGDTSYQGMGGEQMTDGLIRALQYIGTFISILGFLMIIPSKKFKLTVIGQRTLYIYLFHGFFIKLATTYLSDDFLDAISGNYLLLILVSLTICMALGSYLIKKYTRPLIELRL